MLKNEITYQMLRALIEYYKLVFDMRCYLAAGIENLSYEDKIEFSENYAEIPRRINLIANYISKDILPASLNDINLPYLDKIVQELIEKYPQSQEQLKTTNRELNSLLTSQKDSKDLTTELTTFLNKTDLTSYAPIKSSVDYLSSVIAFKKNSQNKKKL